jgi:hypothetical protein
VVNTQNYQIHVMRAYLGQQAEYLALNFTAESVGPHCEHEVNGTIEPIAVGGTTTAAATGTTSGPPVTSTVLDESFSSASLSSSFFLVSSTPVGAGNDAGSAQGSSSDGGWDLRDTIHLLVAIIVLLVILLLVCLVVIVRLRSSHVVKFASMESSHTPPQVKLFEV